MTRNFITRKKRGKSFVYYQAGTQVDKTMSDRIHALAIPPAWQRVQIAPSERAKVQAQGIDTSGRKQYVYSKAYRLKQEKAKFDRITYFAAQLPQLRKQVEKDLRRRRFDKRKVLACAVSLIDQAYFRVGNKQYAAQNDSYGLTTLRSKHVEVQGDTVTFDFNGKSGQQQHKTVKDTSLARIIKQLDEMPGYELFRYYDTSKQLHTLTSSDINLYIKEHMGDEFTAKDFRTWGGTLAATIELSKQTRSDTQTHRKKAITECIKRVAKRLGNTPAVAKSSYIDPRIIERYESADMIGDVYKRISSIKPKRYLTQDEQCVLKLLTK